MECILLAVHPLDDGPSGLQVLLNESVKLIKEIYTCCILEVIRTYAYTIYGRM